MMITRRILLNFLMAAAASGCSAALDGAEDMDEVGEAELALVGDNALNANALNANALTPSALSATALSPGALTASALLAISHPGSEGALSRELLRYTVGCALTAGQSFSFTWSDGQGGVQQETYPGLLGIAPAWATGPLDLRGQELVSACLAARVNWYGVSVIMSMRSPQAPLKTHPHAGELEQYSDVEGGFWGNLFVATPYARACYNPNTVANSRAHQRDCAAGHLNADQTVSTCGMINIIGSCAAYCSGPNDPGRYYSDCTDPVHGKTVNLVTIGLL